MAKVHYLRIQMQPSNNLKNKLNIKAIPLKTSGKRLIITIRNLNKNSSRVKITKVWAAFSPLKLMPSIEADDLLGFVRFNVPKFVFWDIERPDFERLTFVSVLKDQRPLNINLLFWKAVWTPPQDLESLTPWAEFNVTPFTSEVDTFGSDVRETRNRPSPTFYLFLCASYI